ncbi:conserved hypothetical protein [Aeromonas phage 65]|uniref:Uncharacterized protein n=2 Tax=Ishigurovirus osborne TaxID=260149 RepID=A0A219YCF2_9CAUD|nr:hypothetical protein ST65p247 [Aeromonas phage 65]ADQ53255.1 conserved hypothetical protein [Aeromonas phage 65]APU01630.1 hypothetical protein [Aeromonas phage 65.2]
MKIRFKSEKARQEFADTCYANQAIAEYMGMGTHEAINHNDGIIELIKDGKGIIIPYPYQDLYDGWNAAIYMHERSYFVIEGE